MKSRTPTAEKPFKLYTIEEAAVELDVSPRFVAAMKKDGAPFPGNRTRLVWLNTWLEQRPNWQYKSS